MLYQLMNKNTVVATYCEHKDIDDFLYEEVERFDPYLPYGFIDINDWIDGRAIAKHRTSIEKLMRELGLTTRHDFIGMIRCLSLTDTFWTMALWGGLAATAVEYAVHLLYDRLLGVRFWDYSQVRWNLRGRVCLPFSLVWGLLTAAALPPLQGALMPWLSALPVGLTYALLLVTTADGVISAALLRKTRDPECLRLGPPKAA